MTDHDRDVPGDDRAVTPAPPPATGGSTASASAFGATGETPDSTGARLAASRHESGWSGLVGDIDRFTAEWDRIEIAFVDDPRRAVEKADRLVGEVIQALTDSFSDTRTRLEEQWDKGADVSTEDLRLTLQRYRAFFARLLPN